jgi:hypothetical protein
MRRPKSLGRKPPSSSPAFRFWHLGAGRYEVWKDRGEEGRMLGRIYTTAPVALAINSGKWFALGIPGRFDSMNAAAAALLAGVSEQDAEENLA